MKTATAHLKPTGGFAHASPIRGGTGTAKLKVYLSIVRPRGRLHVPACVKPLALCVTSMTLTKEYKNQSTWRNWESYIESLPIAGSDSILDLGCGTGIVTNLLARKASHVIGIDINSDLLKEAGTVNSSTNIQFINADLKTLKEETVPLANGIWTSFTVAYFPAFSPILDNWITLLKPNSWIAIVEMNDLFAHFPLRENTQNIFKKYYERQRLTNIYDFEMGSKIKEFLLSKGLQIISEKNIADRELTFNGPADKEILTAWENRLDRMVALQEFIGKDAFPTIKKEFLDCLTSEDHTCKTEVKFIIARK